VPFWHKGYTDYRSVSLAYAVYDQEALCFVTATNVPPDGSSSKICEVKYQLYNYDGTNGDPKCEGWLMRSVTGDASSPVSKWNYFINTLPWPGGVVSGTGATSVFSADTTSSEAYQKVIPYVTKLEFTTYYRSTPPDKNPAWIAAHPDNNIDPDNEGDGSSGSNNYKMTFPYSVRIELKLMDQQSWLKWKAMGGTRYYKLDTGASVDAGEETDNFRATQIEFRKQNERTFVKTIILGERGQN
jgi:hypothetical protein